MTELKSFIVLYNGKFIRAYEEKEADKLIADLKKACKDKDDWCTHTLKELLSTKRALWLARAKRNRDLRTLSNFRMYVESLVKTKLSIYFYPTRGLPSTQLHKCMMDLFDTWCKYLKIAEDKCLKKAEEYK